MRNIVAGNKDVETEDTASMDEQEIVEEEKMEPQAGTS